MREVERIVLDNDIISIKADTNHDNGGMLRVFEKLGYIYCGKVYFRGSARQAFEKVLL
jgi:RimJ/RimL family protein N-acetyltransferase